MRKAVVFGLCFIVLLCATAGAQTTVTGDVPTASALNVVLTDQNPSPAEPGMSMNIEVEVQNTGTAASDVTVELVPKEPFSVMPGTSVSKTFTTISGKSSVKASYEMFVSSAAHTGSYELEFRIYTTPQKVDYVTKKVSVYVKGTPDLILEDLTLPDGIEPGGMTELTATVKNIGTGTAGRLKLTFTATEEMIPVLAKGTIYLGDIEAGQSKDAVIGLSIDSEAEHKTYTTTLAASYLDEDNTLTEKSFNVGIPVTGSVALDIIKIEPDYGRGSLRVEVSNKGTAEIKSLEARLVINGEDIGVEYTSSLKANKKTTLSFPLILSGSGSLEMSFLGPGTEENSISKPVVLNFEAQQGNGTTLLLYAAVIVVVILAAYWFMRKRKKRK